MSSVPDNLPATADVRSTLRELALAAFASAMSMRVCDAMLPQLAVEFQSTVTELASVVTAFAIAYGVFSLVHGPIGDRHGKLRLIRVASAVAALSSLACWFAWNPTSLIGFRFLTGAACAAIIPLALAWIGDSVPIAQRQSTLASFAAAPILGLIAGQIVGGVFTDMLGWRSGFIVPIALFGLAAWRLGEAARRPVVPSETGQSVIAGYLALLENPRARFLMITVAIEGAAAFGVLAFIPTYLHIVFDVPLWQAGLLVACYGLGGLVFASSAARFIARIGVSNMPLAGGMAVASGFLAVSVAPTWAVVAIGSTLAGMGFSMLHNTLQTGATQAHPQARGTAIAGFALCLFLGQSLGVALTAEAIERFEFRIVFAALAFTLGALSIWVWRAKRAQRF